ncbi:hypothetical protein BB561_000679 [Smittium simulii]|uniref:RNA helicase n=1 Tax=Smittium simulii TaxID=133385 RepID=A0A2T9YY48_9FUNG|nr:hypothetical protein BB561_000679 [Smittium simulii]
MKRKSSAQKVEHTKATKADTTVSNITNSEPHVPQLQNHAQKNISNKDKLSFQNLEKSNSEPKLDKEKKKKTEPTTFPVVESSLGPQTTAPISNNENVTPIPDSAKQIDDNKSTKAYVEPEYKFPTSVTPKACSFSDLGLGAWLIEALKAVEIKSPTETQRASIKPIIEGKDVISCAKTGSGKTAAFALPILHKLAQDPYGVFALVLSPTRELAIQIGEQFTVFGKSINLKISVIVGGLDMVDQALSLNARPHIVIATPGRLADHIKSNSDVINFNKVKFLVLDEADRLLTDSFAPDMSVILEKLPKEKQTLMFTATISESIYQYYLRKKDANIDPFVHICQDNIRTVDTLSQLYMLVPSYVKDGYLVQLLLKPEYEDISIIIFTNMCRTAESVNIMLRHLGFKSNSLHSKMSQHERLNSINLFKAQNTKILVTTGVASRGLDIPSVELVVNFDTPSDADEYIHRVGRTARIGRSGSAITIMTERDEERILSIENRIGKKLDEIKVSEKEVVVILSKVIAARRVATMNLIDKSFGEKDRIRKKKVKRAKRLAA